MSTDATSPSATTASGGHLEPTATVPADKGKGKLIQDDPMDEDDDDDDEDEDEDEDDDMGEEDDFGEIDTQAIINTGGRRTRGVRVDYTSEEALAKAGLKPGDDAEDPEDAEDSFVAKDDEEMHD